ncbi:hypothetical protein FA15DRAFT_670100 [Coprinopsis marcescibilis]|uniref:Uncharacterized protein n=1 Tax=Coprinopsis marcescibilis TaxID=230819 RepID=A0A5C3KUN9_COPMA|nr:hypothetical protein FA15DRAFT_670100 [Coprinopsis marcescibilis]
MTWTSESSYRDFKTRVKITIESFQKFHLEWSATAPPELRKNGKLRTTRPWPRSKSTCSVFSQRPTTTQTRSPLSQRYDPPNRSRITINCNHLSVPCSLARHSASDGLQSKSACVAIQEVDDTLDAIVITTLPRYPFCCHANLMSLPRDRLLEVIRLLNSRLPRARQIPTSSDCPNWLLRSCIEALVGIRLDNFNGTKLSTSFENCGMYRMTVEGMPVAPFASLSLKTSCKARDRKRRGHSMVHSSPSACGLERLDEAQEEEIEEDHSHVRLAESLHGKL